MPERTNRAIADLVERLTSLGYSVVSTPEDGGPHLWEYVRVHLVHLNTDQPTVTVELALRVVLRDEIARQRQGRGSESQAAASRRE